MSLKTEAEASSKCEFSHSGELAGALSVRPLWLTALHPIHHAPLAPVLQEGGTPPGPKSGLCLTLRNELSKETGTDKARDFFGKGHPGREQQGKGTLESCSATWLTVLGIIVMGLVSGLSLASHLAWSIFGLTQSPPWRQAQLSAKMDSSVRVSGRLGQDMSLLPPPFGPSWILLVIFQWQYLILYWDLLLWDNSGKWLMPGQGKWFWSWFPNTWTKELSRNSTGTLCTDGQRHKMILAAEADRAPAGKCAAHLSGIDVAHHSSCLLGQLGVPSDPCQLGPRWRAPKEVSVWGYTCNPLWTNLRAMFHRRGSSVLSINSHGKTYSGWKSTRTLLTWALIFKWQMWDISEKAFYLGESGYQFFI